jgi:hypothetical protein
LHFVINRQTLHWTSVCRAGSHDHTSAFCSAQTDRTNYRNSSGTNTTGLDETNRNNYLTHSPIDHAVLVTVNGRKACQSTEARCQCNVQG